MRRVAPAGLPWWQETARYLVPYLSPENNAMIADEIVYQSALNRRNIPVGVVHADLFPDNVLFENGQISGTIDFYYAGDDAWLYDLAVVANAWCSEADGRFDRALVTALWDAYVATRPLQTGEDALWFPLLRAAALRFWLLRLDAIHFRRPGTITQCKDPEEYRRILLMRQRGA